MKSLGRIIADARVGAGMTQDDLAMSLNVTRQAVSNWERDVKIPDVCSWLAICEVLDIPSNALVVAADMRMKKPVRTLTQDVTDMVLSAFDTVLMAGANVSDHEAMMARVEHLMPALLMVLLFSEVPGKIVLGMNLDAELSDSFRSLKAFAPAMAQTMEDDVVLFVDFVLRPRLTQADLDGDERLQRQLDLMYVVDGICDLASRVEYGVSDVLPLLEYRGESPSDCVFVEEGDMRPWSTRPVVLGFPDAPQCGINNLPSVWRAA